MRPSGMVFHPSWTEDYPVGLRGSRHVCQVRLMRAEGEWETETLYDLLSVGSRGCLIRVTFP